MKHTKEDVLSEIKRAKLEYGVAHFPGLLKDVTPEWADFIDHLNVMRNSGDGGSTPDGEVERYLGQVIKRSDSKFYFYAGGGGSGLLEYAQKAEALMRDTYGLGEILNGGPSYTGAFMNFAVEEFNVPLHGDDRDTIFWQCIGRTTWTIQSPNPDDMEHLPDFPYNEIKNLLTVTLEPGDVLYLGHRVRHGVEIFEPRAGIAFKGTVGN